MIWKCLSGNFLWEKWGLEPKTVVLRAAVIWAEAFITLAILSLVLYLLLVDLSFNPFTRSNKPRFEAIDIVTIGFYLVGIFGAIVAFFAREFADKFSVLDHKLMDLLKTGPHRETSHVKTGFGKKLERPFCKQAMCWAEEAKLYNLQDHKNFTSAFDSIFSLYVAYRNGDDPLEPEELRQLRADYPCLDDHFDQGITNQHIEEFRARGLRLLKQVVTRNEESYEMRVDQRIRDLFSHIKGALKEVGPVVPATGKAKFARHISNIDRELADLIDISKAE